MNTFIARASSPNWSVSLKKTRHGMTWNFSICGKTMKPANANNPTPEKRIRWLQCGAIDVALRIAQFSHFHVERVAIHRLNRLETSNAPISSELNARFLRIRLKFQH